jgi:hypothetical protein
MTTDTLLITDELRESLFIIGRKVRILMKTEVEKLTNDPVKRIVIMHTILENLYQSDKEAISVLGLNIKIVDKDEKEI